MIYPAVPLESGSGAVSVVHIHMGNSLPAYFWDTVRQTRRFHNGPILCVLPVAEIRSACVQELDLTVVPNDSFGDDVMVRAVQQASWLDKRYGGEGFWHFTLLRLFVLEALMRRYALRSCLHLENDVLIYRTPISLFPILHHVYGDKCVVAPLGPSAGCTAAIMYVGSRARLEALCHAVLRLLKQDEASLIARLGADMVNEMVLLGIVRLEQPDLLDVFPVSPVEPLRRASVKRVFKPWARSFLRIADWCYPKVLDRIPAENLTRHLTSIGFIFDPAFWGQYVGGTPHGDGPGFSASHHWIGNDLAQGRFVLNWEQDEMGRRVPFVSLKESAIGLPNSWPLFNLHIHCKRVLEFV